MTQSHVSEPRKQRRGVLRQENLLDAFLTLAAEHGIFSVSLEQIARHCGVAKATVYKHFSSKDEILALVYLRFYEPFTQEVLSLPQDLAVVPRLRRVVRLYLSWHLQNPALSSVIMISKHFVDVRKLPAPLVVRWQNFQRQRIEVADAIIKLGIEEQVFRPIDPRWLSEVGVRMLDGVLTCFFEMSDTERQERHESLTREAEDMLIKSFMRH
ncbi:TetR/AcrR family transcriptional regulator [Oligoflexus tunisiensis]|uniref:TetR/AcrR family transcriptional regulator n=1 Tax=Oligoflexus tunisiensis TaxID=708132 RepID=UPI000A885A03|nr:TetR/AcrR family transcriptional regulator [Oligoflexus tunisiensis]